LVAGGRFELPTFGLWPEGFVLFKGYY